MVNINYVVSILMGSWYLESPFMGSSQETVFTGGYFLALTIGVCSGLILPIDRVQASLRNKSYL